MKNIYIPLITIIIFPLVMTSMVLAAPWVKVDSTGSKGSAQLLTDYDGDGVYQQFFIQGVGYEPLPIGRSGAQWGDTNIYDDDAILHRDFQLLADMNTNAIRIWKADNTNNVLNEFPNYITTKTLDLADQYGLKVIPGFWIGFDGYWQCGTSGREFIWSQAFFDLNNDRIWPSVRQDILDRWTAFVTEFKDHPGVLFWSIGNENNIQLGTDVQLVEAFYTLINDMAVIAHSIDPNHPVAYVNGGFEVPVIVDQGNGPEEVNHFPYLMTQTAVEVDIWGVNIYPGETFGDLFRQFNQDWTPGLPLWISEFGIDAWHSDRNDTDGGYEDQTVQAQWDGKLWEEIVAANELGVIGATIMSYADEWWKPDQWLCQTPFWEEWWRPWWEFLDDGGGTYSCGVFNNSHDLYGIPPLDTDCDGVADWVPPSPDGFFNEEWWGIMKPQRNLVLGEPDVMIPREVYQTLQTRFSLGLSTSKILLDPDQGIFGDHIVISGRGFGQLLEDANYDPKTDLDRDGTVTLDDFMIFSASYNRVPGQEGYNAGADFNQDSVIDLGDFYIFMAAYGSSANGTYVKFAPTDSAFARIIRWNDTEIVCEAPLGVQTGDVVVHTPDGVSDPVVFTVTGGIQIDAVSASQGYVGDAVWIYGNGFGDQQGTGRVEFSGVEADILSWSDTEIICKVPAAPTGNIYLISDTRQIFVGYFNVLQALSVTGMSSTSVAKEQQMTVYGTGFTEYVSTGNYNPAADFNGDAAVNMSDWMILLNSYGTTQGDAAYNGYADLDHDGTVNIDDFNIFASSYNSTRGENYILFADGVEARVISWNDTQIVCEVPYFAQSGDVVVMIGGIPSNPQYIEVLP